MSEIIVLKEIFYIGGKCGITEVQSNKSVRTNGVSVLSGSCY